MGIFSGKNNNILNHAKGVDALIVVDKVVLNEPLHHEISLVVGRIDFLKF